MPKNRKHTASAKKLRHDRPFDYLVCETSSPYPLVHIRSSRCHPIRCNLFHHLELASVTSYADEVLDPEELVVSVYGGDSRFDKKILRRLEVLAHVRREDKSLVWFVDVPYRITFDGPVWVTALTCSTPQKLWFTGIREVNMPCGLPRFIERGDTSTIRLEELACLSTI